MPQQTDRLRQIPNEDVPQRVAILMADPRFVSLCVRPDGPNTSTIEVTLNIP